MDKGLILPAAIERAVKKEKLQCLSASGLPRTEAQRLLKTLGVHGQKAGMVPLAVIVASPRQG